MNTKPPDPPPESGPARILVVDDNEFNRMLMKVLLAPNFQVAVAGDAPQALDLALSFRPHLILMDLELPGMDGLTLTRQLRAATETRDIRIVALTAHAAEDVEAAVRAAGCAGLLTKPVDPGTLTATVRRYLGSADAK